MKQSKRGESEQALGFSVVELLIAVAVVLLIGSIFWGPLTGFLQEGVETKRSLIVLDDWTTLYINELKENDFKVITKEFDLAVSEGTGFTASDNAKKICVFSAESGRNIRCGNSYKDTKILITSADGLAFDEDKVISARLIVRQNIDDTFEVSIFYD